MILRSLGNRSQEIGSKLHGLPPGPFPVWPPKAFIAPFSDSGPQKAWAVRVWRSLPHWAVRPPSAPAPSHHACSRRCPVSTPPHASATLPANCPVAALQGLLPGSGPSYPFLALPSAAPFACPIVRGLIVGHWLPSPDLELSESQTPNSISLTPGQGLATQQVLSMSP